MSEEAQEEDVRDNIFGRFAYATSVTRARLDYYANKGRMNELLAMAGDGSEEKEEASKAWKHVVEEEMRVIHERVHAVAEANGSDHCDPESLLTAYWLEAFVLGRTFEEMHVVKVTDEDLFDSRLLE